MCYDIKTNLETQLKRAKHYSDEATVKEIMEKLAPLLDFPLHHASGFSHPKVLIYTNTSPEVPVVSTWGLVPHWVKDEKQLKQLWNKTLNARGETIFEKPSFRSSATKKRCIVYVDGFFEHHHAAGKTFPYFIHRKDGKPMAFAGLWSEWTNKVTGEILNTFSIVTTKGNPLMAHIHNNPKLSEARMPVILPDELENDWLQTVNDDLDKKEIQELVKSFPEDAMDAHTVVRLRGKDYPGNVGTITEKVVYEELES